MLDVLLAFCVARLNFVPSAMASEVVGNGNIEGGNVPPVGRLGSHLLRVIKAYPKVPEPTNGGCSTNGGGTNGGGDTNGKGGTNGGGGTNGDACNGVA